MTIWFTSDTHFGHAAVVRHSKRPFGSVDEMDRGLIYRWNAVVDPRDTVWHLGDFAWKNPDWYLQRLQGSVHLILGNHDQKVSRLRSAGFASIHDVFYLRHDGLKIYLSHYAHRTWRNCHHGAWHLYGHWHGDGTDLNCSTDVGVDAWNYRPVSLEQLRERFAGREPTWHHTPQDD